MTIDTKKIISKNIQELYLYPYRSKGENVLRCGAWIASWIIGVVVQHAADQRAIGGAYFIFALSLLLEFVPQSKFCTIARLAHGAFCGILFIMVPGSLLLIFGDASTISGESSVLCRILVTSPTWGGWAIFFMLLIGVLLVLTEAHKFFYDEENEQQRTTEAQYETERDRFLMHLNGPQKGGDA